MAQGIDIAWRQVRGAREYQEDCATVVSVDGARHLLVLADGMGGHVGGATASSVVVQWFVYAWHDPNAPRDAPERLLFALQSANLALYDRVLAEPDLTGMGTTLLAALVEDRSLHWVSVGDSPLWLCREKELIRLNANHSMAAVLDGQVREGRISAREAARSPDRSRLLAAVTGDDIDLVDRPRQSIELPEEGVLILASDGVETCSPEETARLLDGAEGDAAALAGRLIDAVVAHQAPHQDNATVILLRLSAVPDRRDSADG